MKGKVIRMSIPASLAAVLLATAGCPGNDPVTGPPAATATPVPAPPTATRTPAALTTTPTPAAITPSPTPLSTASIAGTWTGTYYPDADPPDDNECETSIPIEASFVQAGQNATGHVTSTIRNLICFYSPVRVDLVIQDFSATGTMRVEVSGDHGATLRGSVIPERSLDLRVEATNMSPFYKGGRMWLHR